METNKSGGGLKTRLSKSNTDVLIKMKWNLNVFFQHSTTTFNKVQQPSNINFSSTVYISLVDLKQLKMARKFLISATEMHFYFMPQIEQPVLQR